MAGSCEHGNNQTGFIKGLTILTSWAVIIFPRMALTQAAGWTKSSLEKYQHEHVLRNTRERRSVTRAEASRLIP